MTETHDFTALAAGITAAYAAGNHLPASALPDVLATVHGALRGLEQPAGALVSQKSPAEIRASVRHDAIISFEDGRPYKALRRHLTMRGISPEQYRAKWGLPVDYPMTSPAYSARRTEISKAMGLGRVMRQAAE